MPDTSTPPRVRHDDGVPHGNRVRALIRRVARIEIMVGAAIAAVMLVLVVIEPGILEAPFENWRTVLFTVGGTVLAALAFGAMLWFRVPPPIRVVVLVVPFAVVNWWLISPYFVDDVVDEAFSVSISEQAVVADDAQGSDPAPATPAAPTTAATGSTITTGDPDPAPTGAPPTAAPTAAPATEVPASEEPPSGPVLLGAGRFVGLAGHTGTGDAGLFRNPDGSLVLRFENFDIENGPDLEVYLVPGADQVVLADGSIHLGALKGNVGDQNYELPAGTDLVPGAYTALVWCEAFSVEFVGATIVI